MIDRRTFCAAIAASGFTRPLRAQARTPTAKAAIRKTKNPRSEKCGLTRGNSSQAASVPAVPGATGERPLPKPRAMKCAG